MNAPQNSGRPEGSQVRHSARTTTPRKTWRWRSIVEAAELVERFQWLSPEESAKLDPERREQVRQEIADVLIYLTRLADLLEIDLLDAVRDKLEINARKYPVEQAKGNAAKYNEF